jgi:glucose-1-phosphate thymidylyltransferase
MSDESIAPQTPRRKGILLAAGAGSRLYPVTRAVNKQLAPIYDKPLLYYPLSVLMLSGIRDILLITAPHEREIFKRLLGSGSDWRLNIEYAEQMRPEGIAQAFLIGRDFIGTGDVTLALGDNIFYGHGFPECLQRASARTSGATVFGYKVQDPERYGVVEFDSDGRAVSIEEKPLRPRSSYAVTGLYFYDNEVINIACGLKPSARGELEITDVNVEYLRRRALTVEKLGRGFAWLDTGTHESMHQASNFIQAIQERQGMRLACLEEIAFRMGYITAQDVVIIAKRMGKSSYGAYLTRLVERSD